MSIIKRNTKEHRNKREKGHEKLLVRIGLAALTKGPLVTSKLNSLMYHSGAFDGPRDSGSNILCIGSKPAGQL